MSDIGLGKPAPRRTSVLRGRLNRLISSPRFQSWASRFVLTRGIARRDGEALFDLVAGFVHSQVLHALVDLRILHMVSDGPLPARAIAAKAGMPEDRAVILLNAGTALGLLKARRGGRFGLARKGAALLGVPGLEAMILHHGVLYRDLSDPADFFRGDTDPDLQRFWPYVFGAAAEVEPEIARRYSNLMADSQGLVAEETLRAVSFRDTRRLLDVGGGTGAFLTAVATAWPDIDGTLFDLPAVVPDARQRFATHGIADRIAIVPGSFRTDPLPGGHDTISLVRVLYDHSDDTVAALLASVHSALPKGGRLIVSEPMSGGAAPERAGDAYFAVYTLAMGTGRTRSPDAIAGLLKSAGFTGIEARRTHRRFVTSVLTAVH